MLRLIDQSAVGRFGFGNGEVMCLLDHAAPLSTGDWQALAARVEAARPGGIGRGAGVRERRWRDGAAWLRPLLAELYRDEGRGSLLFRTIHPYVDRHPDLMSAAEVRAALGKRERRADHDLDLMRVLLRDRHGDRTWLTDQRRGVIGWLESGRAWPREAEWAAVLAELERRLAALPPVPEPRPGPGSGPPVAEGVRVGPADAGR